MVYLLLNRVVYDKAVDYHIPLLAYSQSSIGRLNVHHRVPVRIKDHYLISTLQIDSKSSDLGCEKENEHSSVIVEPIDQWLSLVDRDIAIHPERLIAPLFAKLLNDIQHLLSLAEYKHLISIVCSLVLAVPLIKKVEENT